MEYSIVQMNGNEYTVVNRNMTLEKFLVSEMINVQKRIQERKELRQKLVVVKKETPSEKFERLKKKIGKTYNTGLTSK